MNRRTAAVPGAVGAARDRGERTSLVSYVVRDAVAEVLLDHPPVNGITDTLLDELMACLRMAGDDPDVRAIVLGSALPGRFCAGLDLPHFANASDRTSMPWCASCTSSCSSCSPACPSR